MKKTLVLVALLATFAFAPHAMACSVMAGWPPSTEALLAEKDAAFVGTVTSIIQDKSLNGEYRISFDVSEIYKGMIGDTITVRAESSSAACGYDNGYDSFKAGSVWLIYADGSAAEGYRTDSISTNTKYDSVSAAKTAAAKLGLTPVEDEPVACTMQYAPVCGKSADGTVKTYGNSCMMAAEKAEMLYQGECRTDVAPPKQDLWRGMRGADVTWLQEFLIGKLTGAAASALKAVGATGYFGQLTQNALAEYQAAHKITPAKGYFGAKTRAAVTNDLSTSAVTFEGKIEAVNTGCFADGICSVTVDRKEVVLLTGLRVQPIPPVGTLKGVDSIGDLEGKIGATAKVHAVPTTESWGKYTLYGSTSYYVEVLK